MVVHNDDLSSSAAGRNGFKCKIDTLIGIVGCLGVGLDSLSVVANTCTCAQWCRSGAGSCSSLGLLDLAVGGKLDDCNTNYDQTGKWKEQ